jgi:hypothetical protein
VVCLWRKGELSNELINDGADLAGVSCCRQTFDNLFDLQGCHLPLLIQFVTDLAQHCLRQKLL